MPDMILNRDATLTTRSGHYIAFKKGESTYVPPVAVREAVAIGAELEDGSSPDFAPTAKTAAPTDPVTRAKATREAIEELVLRNERGDFNAAGIPSAKAIAILAGFRVDERDIAREWLAYQEHMADPHREANAAPQKPVASKASPVVEDIPVNQAGEDAPEVIEAADPQTAKKKA